MGYIRIEGEKGLVRDMHSKAILPIDRQQLNSHRQKISQTAKIKRMEVQINTMQAQMGKMQVQIDELLNANRK